MKKTLSVDEARNGRFLTTAFKALEKETIGVTQGIVTLTIQVKDGHLLRYVTSRERSFVPGKPMTGGQDGK
jgi:hypothetical protein